MRPEEIVTRSLLFSLVILLLTPIAPSSAVSAECRLLSNPQQRLQCWDASGEKTSANKEDYILTYIELMDAVAYCGFNIDDDEISRFLSATGMSAKDIWTLPRSPAFQVRVDELSASFRGNAKKAACYRSWANYGPDGAMRHFFRP